MRTVLILFLLSLANLSQAQVYRSVDKDGNVIFTDEPSEGAEEVEVKELETIRSLEPPPLPGDRRPPVQQEFYKDIEISSPDDDASIRDNAGNFSVTATVSPNLRSGHKLVLYMDGVEYATGTSSTFQLENVDRGTHQLRVAVVDNNGRQQISSKSVTVHLLRQSVAQPKPPGNPPPKSPAN